MQGPSWGHRLTYLCPRLSWCCLGLQDLTLLLRLLRRPEGLLRLR